MKFKLTLAILSWVFYFNAKAQVASKDALDLKPLFETLGTDQAKFDQINEILIKYVPQSVVEDPAFNSHALQAFFTANPFIPNNYKTFVQTAAPAALTGLLSKIGGIGNANISTYADGLAKFLIKRSKEEILISFFSKLQDEKKFPEFQKIFPHCKKLLDNFKSWEYSNIINTLREAFDKDLKEILGNIPSLLDLKSTDYEGDVKKRVDAVQTFFATEGGRYFISALQIGNGFIGGSKIPDVIHTIAGARYLGNLPGVSNNVTNSIRLFDILSYSIRDESLGSNYITLPEFTSIISDATAGPIYQALVWQQIKNQNIIIGTVDVAMFLTPANIANITAYINNLINSSVAINAAFHDLVDARLRAEPELAKYYAKIFALAGDFFESATRIQLINPVLRFPNTIQKAIEAANQTLEIAHDIAVRNYSAVIVGTLNLFSVYGGLTQMSSFSAFFVKYGSFAANLVQAQNSDEAEKAIESVALPVGSASIKKHSTWNIAINAYLGAFWGNEYLADKKQQNWAQISGVCAPVGVTFSHKLGRGSASAFISLIDVGAFASYRLKDDSTELLPAVTLKNIFAPGLGIIYGFPKVPVSIGYTYQLGPALREINKGEVIASDKANKRWQFFLAIDIPIANLYSKRKE